MYIWITDTSLFGDFDTFLSSYPICVWGQEGKNVSEVTK